MVDIDDKNYDTEEVVVVVDSDFYIKGFRDTETFEEYCRQCPNYGNRWGCPPFDHDTLQDLLPYSKVMIVGVVLTPHDTKLPMSQVYDLMLPELERLNKHLLELEKKSGGKAFGFVGKCQYCGDASCARIQGHPCRHPDLVRPSLEAYGFNMIKTASELLGIDMLWSNDDRIPKYLTLVCGLFFNGDDLKW